MAFDHKILYELGFQGVRFLFDSGPGSCQEGNTRADVANDLRNCRLLNAEIFMIAVFVRLKLHHADVF